MKNGSALLLVVFITTMLTVSLGIIWRATIYAYDFSLKRVGHEQVEQISQSLMRYAIALVKENFKHITDNSLAFTLKMQHWHHYNTRHYDGVVTIKYVANSVKIDAHLFDNTVKIKTISCSIFPRIVSGIPQLVIDQWNSNAQGA